MKKNVCFSFISDMAFFLFDDHHSLLISRLNILALIVLVCCCTYCSSSPIIDVDSSIDDIDMFNINDEMNYSPSSYDYIDAPEQEILPSNNRLLYLLLKSALSQPDYRQQISNDKRYTSQAFHAMRG
jgi:hypothetical protein